MAGKNIPSLEDFRKSIDSAEHGSFARSSKAKANESEFPAMKAHILGLYHGVTEVHSFEDENGSIFDCIPVTQQPALKGAAPAKAPDLPTMEKKADAHGEPVGDWQSIEIQPGLHTDKTDKHGNKMACPPDHIPMRRVTLEELTRFESMKHFFQKSPEGGGRPPRTVGNPTAELEPSISPAVAATHRWAHAFQNVNNLGGHSYINLWDPADRSEPNILAVAALVCRRKWRGSTNPPNAAGKSIQANTTRRCRSSSFIGQRTITTRLDVTTSIALRLCRRITP